MSEAETDSLIWLDRSVMNGSFAVDGLHSESDLLLRSGNMFKSEVSLELAEMYNPCIRGWITYYSHFYKTRLRPTLKRIDAYVIRWARRKFKRMRHQTKGARDWFGRLHRATPALRPLATMSWQRPNIGSRVNREVHARFWERLGVKLLRATRQPAKGSHRA